MRSVRQLPEIHHDSGLHLLGSVLWMDATRRRELCFVSHAGVPGARLHKKVLCTDATARLATLCSAGRPVRRPLNALLAPYGRPFSLGPLRMELVPSGFSLGAAQLLVETGGARVLYTGDLCLRKGPTPTLAEGVPADVLVVDATLADPALATHDHATAVTTLLGFVRQCLDDGLTPILLCDPVGVAQEVMALLDAHDHPLSVHPTIAKTCSVHAQLGAPPPSHRVCPRRDLARDPREVVLWPKHTKPLSNPKAQRSRMLTLLEAPEELPIEETSQTLLWRRHPTLPEILELVRDVGPSRIYAWRGHERALCEALRQRGHDAQELSAGRQLWLFPDA